MLGMATGLRALLLMASLHALHCFSKPGLHLARRNAAVAPQRAPISASIGEVAFSEHLKQAAVDVVQGVGVGRCVSIGGLGVSEMPLHGRCRATLRAQARANLACISPPHLACAHHACLHARYTHRLIEAVRLRNMNGRVLSLQDRSGMA